MPDSQLRVNQRGIARTLVVAMILFSSLITLVATAIQLYRDYQRDLLLIDSQLQQIQDSHQRSLASSLWLLDEDGMQLIVDGIIQLPDILYVEVRDDEKIRASGGQWQTDNVIEREYNLVHEDSGQRIGMITAVATLENLYQRLIDKTVDILVSNAIKTFLVAGFMLLFFHFLVTRHLITIASFIRSQTLDSKSEELRLNRKQNKADNADELDLVVEELNIMRSSLHRSYLTLKESETRHRDLFDMMAQGVIYRDQQGAIVSANNAAREILGLSLGQMQGKEDLSSEWRAIYENGEPIQDAAFPSTLTLRLEEPVDDFVMGVFHPGEKRYRWILVSSKPWNPSADGAEKLAFSTFTDITRRKQADQEREQLIRELEIKNAELERFVYTISHELKAPLVTIAGFSGYLIDNVTANRKEKLSDDIMHINSAVKTMSTLLDELIEVARIGGVPESYEDISMSDLASRVVESIRSDPSLPEVWIEIAQDLPSVHGSYRQLEKVLRNLLENAIKFSEPGRAPLIKIGVRRQEEEDVVFVQDNGIGIDPAYHERIFTLFERLDPSIGGTGVGLAIVHRVIEQHGGRVWAESQGEGSGSTFFIAFPRQQLDQVAS